jgi:hypothetical protein
LSPSVADALWEGSMENWGESRQFQSQGAPTLESGPPGKYAIGKRVKYLHLIMSDQKISIVKPWIFVYIVNCVNSQCFLWSMG